MFRSFDSAEEMVQALEAASIVSSTEAPYNPLELYGHFAGWFKEMRYEKNPNILSYWIAMSFWNYARQVYAEADMDAGDTLHFPRSTMYYKQLMNAYSSPIVQALVEQDEHQAAVMNHLMETLERLP